MFALIPENIGLSENRRILSGTSLNDMSGANFGFRKDSNKNVDYESTKSKKSNGDKEKKSEEIKDIGVIHKN